MAGPKARDTLTVRSSLAEPEGSLRPGRTKEKHDSSHGLHQPRFSTKLPVLHRAHSLQKRSVDLNAVHGKFTGEAVSFLSEIRPEDFNASRALWQKVRSQDSRDRFIETVSGHMGTCTDDEIIKRQIGIFREVSEDLAAGIEKGTGIKGYPGIKGLRYNGTHNGMAEDAELRAANGVDGAENKDFNNGAPGQN